jgi:hypothetical protein
VVFAAKRLLDDARFIPAFWSPLHFPNQSGTLGATIDPEHPVFRDFPTSTHTEWQGIIPGFNDGGR